MPLLSELLPIPLSLIQAPMAGCQGVELALAVSAAGALGSLPAATLEPHDLDVALQRLDAAGRPYNLNFFAHAMPTVEPAAIERWHRLLQPYYAAHGLNGPPTARPGRRAFDEVSAEVMSRYRPTVVSFHFGLPPPALLTQVRATGAFIIASATTRQEALWLQDNGADGVIAQGLEAGGHRGHFLDADLSSQQPLAQLLPQVVEAVEIPVIAAGGISQAADVHAAMALGAAAVQVGTAFLLCDEATTPTLHRQRLLDSAEATVLTNLFTGGIARGLPNRLIRELDPLCDEALPFPWASASLAPLRQRAEFLGFDDFSPLWSGTNRLGLQAGPAHAVVQMLALGLKALPASKVPGAPRGSS